MNKRVLDSKLLNSNFNIRSIEISYANDVAELGAFKLGKVLKIILVLTRLLKELLLHRPHFVYFQISPLNLAFYRDLFYVAIIKLFNVKIVYHMHGKGIKNAAKKKWQKRLYKFAFHDSDIICLSNLLAYDIEDVSSGKIHIVNNGIPDITSSFTEISSRHNNIVKILFLSNLLKSKGIMDFIESMSIIKKRGYAFKGLVVGEEGDLSSLELKEEINSKNLFNEIEYLGPKYGMEKDKIINNIDILIFPTTNDIWGNVILEVMQHSKPIVGTKEGAIPEIIDDGITGFLVDKNSPKQIADKLQILLTKPAVREAMGKAGRKKYEEKYTLQIFEENMKKVFEEIMNEIKR